MNTKKLICSLATAAVVMLMSGCGNQSIEDQFVFGKTRVHCADATITINSPFELAVNGKQADLGPRDTDSVNAEGHNQNIQIIVSASRAGSGETVDSEKQKALDIMTSDQMLTNLKTDVKTAKAAGQDAQVLTFTFTENDQGMSTNLTVIEYIFEYKNVVWRTIYQFRTDDPVGKALAERLAGKILPGTVT